MLERMWTRTLCRILLNLSSYSSEYYTPDVHGTKSNIQNQSAMTNWTSCNVHKDPVYGTRKTQKAMIFQVNHKIA